MVTACAAGAAGYSAGFRVLFRWRCTAPEVALRGRYDMIANDGQIGITCEFCSRRYEFDPAMVEVEVGAE